ncbi:MAG: hypothetical protein M1823_004456 [Watsoniomyces obsoletus]|nr:MAG: hypothetical protein M1823_004456 [Watsoniomyces obsoletus]
MHRIVEFRSKRAELRLVAMRESGEVQGSVYRFETSIWIRRPTHEPGPGKQFPTWSHPVIVPGVTLGHIRAPDDGAMHLLQVTTVAVLVVSGWALPERPGDLAHNPTETPSQQNNKHWEIHPNPPLILGMLGSGAGAIYGTFRLDQWRRDRTVIKYFESLGAEQRQMYREDYAYHLYLQEKKEEEWERFLCLTWYMFPEPDNGKPRLRIPTREIKDLLDRCEIEIGSATDKRHAAAERSKQAAAERFAGRTPYPGQLAGGGLTRARVQSGRGSQEEGGAKRKKTKKQNPNPIVTDNQFWSSRLDGLDARPLVNKVANTDWSKASLPALSSMKFSGLKRVPIRGII